MCEIGRVQMGICAKKKYENEVVAQGFLQRPGINNELHTLLWC